MKRIGWLFTFWLAAALGSSACSPGLGVGEDEGGDPNDGHGTGAKGAGTGATPSQSSGGRDGVGGRGVGGEGGDKGGDDDSEGGGGPSSTGGTRTGSGGDSSSGGVIDPGPPGRPGHAIVAGGTLMRSSNYLLVSTTGESPGGNSLMSSKKYRLISGLVSKSE